MIDSKRPEPRRAHFLPKLLLKGFAIPGRKGKEASVYVFRRGAKPFEAGILNVAVEADFYGRPGETSIETDLHAIETLAGPMLDGIRATGEISSDAPPLLADFTSNLVGRTRHFRESFAAAFKRGMERTPNAVLDPGAKASIIREVEAGYRRKLRLPRGSPLPPEVLLRLRSGKIWREVERSGETFRAGAARMDTWAASRKGHLDALQTTVVGGRAERYRTFTWSVFRTTADTPLLLGDCGPLALFHGESTFALPVRESDTPRAIFLPISSELLVIGHSSDAPKVDIEGLNPDLLTYPLLKMSAFCLRSAF